MAKDFRVGQIWLTTDGRQRKIISVSTDIEESHPIKAYGDSCDIEYTKEGYFCSDRGYKDADLATMLSDSSCAEVIGESQLCDNTTIEESQLGYATEDNIVINGDVVAVGDVWLTKNNSEVHIVGIYIQKIWCIEAKKANSDVDVTYNKDGIYQADKVASDRDLWKKKNPATEKTIVQEDTKIIGDIAQEDTKIIGDIVQEDTKIISDVIQKRSKRMIDAVAVGDTLPGNKRKKVKIEEDIKKQIGEDIEKQLVINGDVVAVGDTWLDKRGMEINITKIVEDDTWCIKGRYIRYGFVVSFTKDGIEDTDKSDKDLLKKKPAQQVECAFQEDNQVFQEDTVVQEDNQVFQEDNSFATIDTNEWDNDAFVANVTLHLDKINELLASKLAYSVRKRDINEVKYLTKVLSKVIDLENV